MSPDGNLLANLPDSPLPNEVFEQLLVHSQIRIERIVSTGQASEPGFWYDQPHGEWVLLVQGAASLLFEDEPSATNLMPGDYVYIAPHRRHRVQATESKPATVWLAIHFDNEVDGGA